MSVRNALIDILSPSGIGRIWLDVWCSLDEQLQAHFEKFAPRVVVGDRVGREQPRVKPKPDAAPADAEPGAARPGARRGLFAKVAARGKQLGQIREHD